MRLPGEGRGPVTVRVTSAGPASDDRRRRAPAFAGEARRAGGSARNDLPASTVSARGGANPAPMPYRPAAATLTRRLKTIVLTALLVPAALLALLLLDAELRWRDGVRARVPAALEPGYAYRGDAGSPMGLVRYRIGARAARAIRAEGRAFLDREAGPGWRPTPVPIEAFRPFGDCFGFWCSRSAVATEATRWVSRPGSFVLLPADRDERVVVVNPAAGAVILGYYAD